MSYPVVPDERYMSAAGEFVQSEHRLSIDPRGAGLHGVDEL